MGRLRESYRLLHDGESVSAASNEKLSSLRQFNSLLITLEYGEADLFLQIRNLFAQRWLNDLQTLSCSCEVKFLSKRSSSDLKSNLRRNQRSFFTYSCFSTCTYLAPHATHTTFEWISVELEGQLTTLPAPGWIEKQLHCSGCNVAGGASRELAIRNERREKHSLALSPGLIQEVLYKRRYCQRAVADPCAPKSGHRHDSPHCAVVEGLEVMGWSAPVPTGAHYIQASAEGDRHEEAH
jgi:hypothetical protein